jgi:flagellin-like protein
MMIFNFKKGVSGIIATVLLLLITILAVVIIAGFVLPFIRDNIEDNDSVGCFEIGDKLKILLKDSCYDLSIPETKIRVRLGGVNLTNIYFLMVEDGEREVDRYVLGEGNILDVREMPDFGGGEKTYTFDDKVYKKASVGGVVGDDTFCDVSDDKILRGCM